MKYAALLTFALPCVLATSWIDDAALKVRADGDNVTTKKAPKYTLNLDLDPRDRWNEIGAIYKDTAYKITDYLKSQLPPWAYPLIVQLGEDVEGYFVDYGDEMIGVANALGLDVGEIVATNLIYELERIGVNCSNWNNTGPTLDDDAIPPGLACVDARAAFEAQRNAALLTGPEGLCTSIVTQSSSDPSTDESSFPQVIHGRNLDWNIPDSLKDFVIDLDVTRNGQVIYTATGAVGFVGFLNGMRQQGNERWTVSQDARHHGGYLPLNLLEALATHAMTPEQALRKALETEANGNFEDAVKDLSSVRIICDVYFILGGGSVSGEEAAVVTRDRQSARDVWRLGVDASTPPRAVNPTPSTDWFLVETNYDHWKPVPKADDRSGPANEMMLALGSPEATTPAALFEIMGTWPVFNPHTTFTSMMEPASGLYNTTVYYGNGP